METRGAKRRRLAAQSPRLPQEILSAISHLLPLDQQAALSPGYYLWRKGGYLYQFKEQRVRKWDARGRCVYTAGIKGDCLQGAEIRVEPGAWTHRRNWNAGKLEGVEELRDRHGDLLHVCHWKGGRLHGVEERYMKYKGLSYVIDLHDDPKWRLMSHRTPTRGCDATERVRSPGKVVACCWMRPAWYIYHRVVSHKLAIVYEKTDGCTKLKGDAKPRLLDRTEWKNGHAHGVCEVYYRSGAIHERHHWKNGLPHGVSTLFVPDGRMEGRGHWKDGRQHGLQEHWWIDGNERWLGRLTHYVNGKKMGREMYWEERPGVVSDSFSTRGFPLKKLR